MEDDSEIQPRGERLPGEPAGANEVENAQYWAQSYARLIAFEEEILSRMRELSSNEPDPVKAEIFRTNIEPMERLIEDFRERASRWQRGQISVVPD